MTVRASIVLHPFHEAFLTQGFRNPKPPPGSAARGAGRPVVRRQPHLSALPFSAAHSHDDTVPARADNLSNCVNYRLRLLQLDVVAAVRHDDAHALLRLRGDAVQQLRPDLEPGAL